MISAAELEALVQKIFRSTFELEAVSPYSGAGKPGRHIAAAVSFSGACQGAVVLDLSEELARTIGAVMYGMQPAELGESEIRDSVGELANMCGGSVKALLPSPNQLSLPSVSDGDKLKMCVPGTETVLEGMFGVSGDALKIAVMMKKA